LRSRTVSENLLKIPLFGPSLNHHLRLLGSEKHPQIGVFLSLFSTWGAENNLAEIDLKSTEGDKGFQHLFGSKIGKHFQLCWRVHYRATRKSREQNAAERTR
jgi:hypothetical protein